MDSGDPVAPLIAWYATGALDPQECARVESHLGGCDVCRDLLVTARGFRRLAPRTGQEALFDHIQSQRLVEFAEDPATLEPDARRFITSHVRACAPCAEALEILEDMARAPATDDGGSRETLGSPLLARIRQAWSELWHRLGRTLLHPAPAFAYLAALIVLLVLAPFRSHDTGRAPGGSPQPIVPAAGSPQGGSAPRPPVSLVPPAIELPEEVVFRGGGEPPTPITISLPAGADDLVLDLVTSIASDDLRDPDAEFQVVLLQGDRVLDESRRRGGDFDRRGRMRLLVDANVVTPGVPCLVRIVLLNAGLQGDGEEVYRRSFVLVRDEAPRR